ncbi:hypothetical protein GNI_082890 [Gregarina niphandrodes]|uniref:Non-canonical E2 ubiquitin-conjugating enzyme C-terminal domain-containing protein n=1 Tax=Gregarina niphandrodes TaxID=110365 RepID=A0A023B666_GRENI|nr:hypothetical protein GNI_082890 [Gregarina niphandrodes]EZG65536.1 hypothetical protein GNI_082890 [Gregarina niphandrodes]|eukprot:XP_011134074.1 hypothetical protein GNI_082890 [Gregarina niphandrodes]
MLKNILDKDDVVVVDSEQDEGEDGGILAVLDELAPELKTAALHFKTEDWLRVIERLRKEPSSEVRDIIADVGRELTEKIKEAVDSQYATMTFEDQEKGGDSRTSTTAAAAGEVLTEGAELASMYRAGSMSNRQILKHLSRYTPLRLVYEEREILRLLESTLYISDYTDKVDIIHAGNKNKQILKQIRQICSILTGLVMARDYEEGQRLMKDRDFKSLERFYQGCFEIGRRYKILNPEKMRENYGKLMYVLMDTSSKAISQVLEFDCVTPVRTVYNLLEKKERGLELLDDPLLVVATQEIYDYGLTRDQVRLMQQRKEAATKSLVEKYCATPRAAGDGRRGLLRNFFFARAEPEPVSDGADRLVLPRSGVASEALSEEDVELAIYSLKDHMTFLRYNEKPVDQLYQYLVTFYDAEKPTSADASLAIALGQEGARLTHSHQRQFLYVKQTLLLWKEILRNFLELWTLADSDLLATDGSGWLASPSYRLSATGQGLNRVQPAPRVQRCVNEILRKVMSQCGGWIGSSVVHLGDHNVPNALMFIDKYLQVPRIVQPLIQVLEQLPRQKRPEIVEMIRRGYGDVQHLQ